MYLCIAGFLPNNPVDDLIKFELNVDSRYTDQIVKMLGHSDLNAMSAGEWPLTKEQASQISLLIGKDLPLDLKLSIGVET